MAAIDFFKALSDETRIRLLNLSIHYELNVNEIVTILDMGQSRISRHLKILTDCGLLSFRKDGLWTFYSAASGGEGFNFVQSIKYLLTSNDLFQKDLTAAEICIKERSKKTTRFFDSISKNWELLKQDIIGDLELNGIIINEIHLSDTIVDLGCGTGDLLPMLKTKSNHVIGVEKSSKMLEEARKNFDFDRDGIDIRIGELEHLPLKDEEADIAVTNLVLHHLSEPKKAIKEVHRILKPKGSFIIVDLLLHHEESMRDKFGDLWLGFSIDVLDIWLKEIGFNPINVEHFDLKNGLKGFIYNSEKL
ncbi:ArsR/SmtB family transcription factor [Acidobacteriota bacterium]